MCQADCLPVTDRRFAPPQVEARGLKPNTKYFYQFRYRQNDKTAPVRAWSSTLFHSKYLNSKWHRSHGKPLCCPRPPAGVLPHRPHTHAAQGQ